MSNNMRIQAVTTRTSFYKNWRQCRVTSSLDNWVLRGRQSRVSIQRWFRHSLMTGEGSSITMIPRRALLMSTGILRKSCGGSRKRSKRGSKSQRLTRCSSIRGRKVRRMLMGGRNRHFKIRIQQRGWPWMPGWSDIQKKILAGWLSPHRLSRNNRIVAGIRIPRVMIYQRVSLPTDLSNQTGIISKITFSHSKLMRSWSPINPSQSHQIHTTVSAQMTTWRKPSN